MIHAKDMLLLVPFLDHLDLFSAPIPHVKSLLDLFKHKDRVERASHGLFQLGVKLHNVHLADFDVVAFLQDEGVDVELNGVVSELAVLVVVKRFVALGPLIVEQGCHWFW